MVVKLSKKVAHGMTVSMDAMNVINMNFVMDGKLKNTTKICSAENVKNISTIMKKFSSDLALINISFAKNVLATN